MDTQNSQQLDNNPNGRRENYILFSLIVLICSVLFGIIGFYMGRQKVSSGESQPSPTKFLVEESPTVGQILPTNTEEEWSSYSDNTYSFKYPKAWSVVPGTANTEKYFEGDYVQIVSPSPAVTIEIAPSQFTYGFAGIEHRAGETFNVSIGGQVYSGTEDIRFEEGKTKVYVNMAVPLGGKEFHILFGTGYPVNQDNMASYSDYQKYRDTILEILATLKIKG